MRQSAPRGAPTPQKHPPRSPLPRARQLVAGSRFYFADAMFFGKSAPAPPPPSFLEDAFQQATAKAEELTAQIKTKVEELAAANDLPVEQMWTVIGGTLLLLVGFLAMRSNKKIVATCELGAAGKPCGTSPNKGITPMRSPSDLTTAHLDRRPSAKQFVPERASKVTGTVTLTQENGITTIEYKVVGLEPGKHGFHIHETADFSNGCVSAGVRSLRLPHGHALAPHSHPRLIIFSARAFWLLPVRPFSASSFCVFVQGHYNPFGKTHGGPDDSNRHVGDLGNITADLTGTAKGVIRSSLVKLSGAYSVMGRSIMVHQDEDDLGRGDNSQADVKPPVNGKVSKITGNAGARIACGEIKAVA